MTGRRCSAAAATCLFVTLCLACAGGGRPAEPVNTGPRDVESFLAEFSRNEAAFEGRYNGKRVTLRDHVLKAEEVDKDLSASVLLGAGDIDMTKFSEKLRLVRIRFRDKKDWTDASAAGRDHICTVTGRVTTWRQERNREEARKYGPYVWGVMIIDATLDRVE
jgi:hypothetical protein